MTQKGCKKHLSGPLAARVGMCAGDSYQEYSNPFRHGGLIRGGQCGSRNRLSRGNDWGIMRESLRALPAHAGAKQLERRRCRKTGG